MKALQYYSLTYPYILYLHFHCISSKILFTKLHVYSFSHELKDSHMVLYCLGGFFSDVNRITTADWVTSCLC